MRFSEKGEKKEKRKQPGGAAIALRQTRLGLLCVTAAGPMETCGKPAALKAAANGKCEIRRAEVRLAAAAKLPSEI